VLAFGFLVSAIALVSSAAQAPAQKPQFEVASVKPNAQSGFSLSNMDISGNRFTATGARLRQLIMEAYNLRDWQLVGGPSWMKTDQWDIQAVAEDGVPLRFFDAEDPSRPTAASLMMQSLIEDRFQFKFHREMKELPVYELTLIGSGPKFKPTTERQNPGNVRLGRGDIELQAEPFATFAYMLSRFLDRSLINKVSLSGLFDIKLKWNLDSAPPPGYGRLRADEGSSASDGPSVFTAVQEQLGLKLESAKGPVQVMVIDSVQKPSEN
jgi:uncharacterized protein (TIGR03435 family)